MLGDFSGIIRMKWGTSDFELFYDTTALNETMKSVRIERKENLNSGP
jgi:hypothetical protein